MGEHETRSYLESIRLEFNDGNLPTLESLCNFDKKSAQQLGVKPLGLQGVEATLETARHLKNRQGTTIKGVAYSLDDGEASMTLML